MTTMHFTEKMTATPEQFIAALTDFGPGRSKIWGNSASDYLKVLEQGPTEADVTEGSGGVWETLHYDWSDPGRVVLTTTDSNAWGGHSGWTYSLSPQPDGTTEVDVQVVRDGKNLKGHGLALAFGAGGKRLLEKRFEETVQAIDERAGGRP
jgi:Polyketide cyclase / dehydrase and lipid transport